MSTLWNKRLVNGPKLRKLIPCGYCFEEWADCYDHIRPVLHGGTNAKANLYPACRRCNSLASGLLFKSLDEKRDYVRAKLKEREEWHSADQMREVREALPGYEAMAEILLKSMSIGKVERRENANRIEKVIYGLVCRVCGKRHRPLNEVTCDSGCREVLWFNLLLERYLERQKDESCPKK